MFYADRELIAYGVNKDPWEEYHLFKCRKGGYERLHTYFQSDESRDESGKNCFFNVKFDVVQLDEDRDPIEALGILCQEVYLSRNPKWIT